MTKRERSGIDFNSFYSGTKYVSQTSRFGIAKSGYEPSRMRKVGFTARDGRRGVASILTASIAAQSMFHRRHDSPDEESGFYRTGWQERSGIDFNSFYSGTKYVSQTSRFGIAKSGYEPSRMRKVGFTARDGRRGVASILTASIAAQSMFHRRHDSPDEESGFYRTGWQERSGIDFNSFYSGTKYVSQTSRFGIAKSGYEPSRMRKVGFTARDVRRGVASILTASIAAQSMFHRRHDSVSLRVDTNLAG
ncbi:hypothetical protein J6590_005764 [Homalodisca vitripennis]|nr:hypothetical protein J6590_005764 [Homalodisca vitripennis]